MRTISFLCAVFALVAACSGGGPGNVGHAAGHTFVVDRELDPTRQWAVAFEELDDADFRAVQAEERYEVFIDGDRVTLRPTKVPLAYEGATSVSTNSTEKRFELRGGAADGYFVVRGTDAELTFVTSGKPVAFAERGRLVARRDAELPY